MIVLPSYIEGILSGRKENKAKWKCELSWRNESKNSKKRRSSHQKCQRLGPRTGLAAVGPCQGRGRAQGWAETLRGRWAAEHHPPESWGCPETWLLGAHTASQVTSWPLRAASWGVGRGGTHLAFGVCLFLLAKGEWGEQLLHPPLDARGLAPSTCSDSEKEVTGTCRQEPLTYIKKVYSRESVYISINISCIYINKYIKRKECIILMQHKAVLREWVSKYEHCNLGYTDLGERKNVFDCLFYIFTVLF